MPKKSTKQPTNPIQAKLDSLVAERDSVIAKMNEAKATYDNGQIRLIEINSAINTIVELFSKGANNDSESQVDTEPGTNEG